MRLLVVTDSLGSGGAERQLALTMTHLPEEWDIRCFSLDDGPFATQLREHGVKLDIVERRWRYDPLPFLRLWGLVAGWRPQLVHCWGYMTTLTTFPVYRALGIPFINGRGRGDEILKVVVEVPKNLSEKQKEILREFELQTSDVKYYAKRKSFIDKLKNIFS